jgi:predicted amidohydrolase YtcJ
MTTGIVPQLHRKWHGNDDEWRLTIRKLISGGAMRKTLVEILISGISIVISCSAQTLSQHADRIFTDAKIWTGDDAHPQAQAIAVSGDRLLAVGSDQEIKALAASDTAVIDLGGRLVVPGFQDSHIHFPGRSINEIDLHGVETLKQFQQRLSDFAKAHPSLPWITGHGWGYSAFPNQSVDKKYIDAVISDRPVYLLERDGHMGFGNSKAVQISVVSVL